MRLARNVQVMVGHLAYILLEISMLMRSLTGLRLMVIASALVATV